jgi:hypothetical protein
VAPGRYSFTVINRIPTAQYRVRFGEEPVEIPPLPSFGAAGTTPAACATINTKVEALKQVKLEKDVPGAVEAYQQVRRDETVQTACRTPYITGGDVLVANTTAFAGDWPVRRGYHLIVTVSRLASNNIPADQWTFVFNPGARGAWRITYGFAFPVLRGVADGGVFADQERFFSRQVGDRFVITEGRPTRDFDAVPTVFYSFMPSGDAGFRFNPLTAGLGLDLTKPMVLLGTGFTYNDNLLVTAGLGARQEATLLGRYQAGDTITTNLTEEQLTEQVFRARPFLSVTFRFRSNPFSGGGGGSSTPADKNPPGTPPAKKTPGGTTPTP